MHQIDNYGDQRQLTWCVHCGSNIKGTRDHMPSRVLLDEPYPPNLPIVDVCRTCNSGFSADEEYLACFIECVVCGTTDPDKLVRPKIRRLLKNSESLRLRINKSKSEQLTLDGAPSIYWVPELPRIENVILKLARGHVLYELNEPRTDRPAQISIMPISLMDSSVRDAFESSDHQTFSGWPEAGSRALQRLISGQDIENGWTIVQKERYRFRPAYDGLVSVKIVIREYLAAEISWED